MSTSFQEMCLGLAQSLQHHVLLLLGPGNMATVRPLVNPTPLTVSQLLQVNSVLNTHLPVLGCQAGSGL